MATFCTRSGFTLLGLLFVSLTLYGQSTFDGYMQSQFVLDYKVLPLYSHTNGVELQNTFVTENESFWRVQQIDVYHFSQLKILDNQSIAVGLQYRIEETFVPEIDDEFRLTEQYNYNRRGTYFRHGHRVRVEQQFKEDVTEHRFRYRYTMDIPIKGIQLDLNELYVAMATESLLEVVKGDHSEYDQRIYLDAGLFLNKTIGFEFGLEYRFEDYTHTPTHTLIINSSVNISL